MSTTAVRRRRAGPLVLGDGATAMAAGPAPRPAPSATAPADTAAGNAEDDARPGGGGGRGGGKKAGKRGLSMEEKVAKVAAWMQRHPQPYGLKELLGLLPKQTGVIYQSVEECLEVLVADNVVQREKIGIHVVYWRFPPSRVQRRRDAVVAAAHRVAAERPRLPRALWANEALVAKYAALLPTLEDDAAAAGAAMAALRAEETQLRTQIAARQTALGDPAACGAVVAAWQAERAHLAQLVQRHRDVAANDPALVVRLQDATLAAFEAANRWTDNLHHAMEAIGRHMNSPATLALLREQLGIPEVLEPVEEADIPHFPEERRRYICGGPTVVGDTAPVAALSTAAELLGRRSSPSRPTHVVTAAAEGDERGDTEAAAAATPSGASPPPPAPTATRKRGRRGQAAATPHALA